MQIATLRVLSQYACATCLTPLKYVHQLGTRVDRQRRSHRRVDNSIRQEKIIKARRLIFERGLPVDSKRVRDILQEGSLLPITVSFHCLVRRRSKLIFF